MSKKIAVVTALIGAYDSRLLEFDYDREKYDFICYTNMKRLKSNTWNIIYVDNLAVPSDNARSSYYFKWNPHKYLDKKKYDTMVWVDSSFNAINLNGLNAIVSKFDTLGKSLYIEKHPSRNTLKDELEANVRLNKDDTEAMKRHVQKYFNEGYPDNKTVMVETGFSIRNYKNPDLIKFSEAIWNEISPLENTKRDQLVYDYCMWKTNFTDYALFTFQEKCEVIRFVDHPNRPKHKDKVLLVGPWLGEASYEPLWIEHVKQYLSTNPVDKVYVGCREDREYLYSDIDPDRFILSNNDGIRRRYLLDGHPPIFNIKKSENVDVITLSPNAEWFKDGKLKRSSPVNPLDRKVNVYINYYEDKNPDRNSELTYCLDRMVDNKYIDKIYLIIDSEAKPSYKKSENIYVDKRPTYQDIFHIINSKTSDTDINIIINSDCFMDEESVKLVKDNIDIEEVWALNRKEVIDIIDNEPVWTLGINESGSQDCWINIGKYREIQESNFTMGIMGCDNRIAYLFYEAGYVVLNPSKDVHVFHNHKTNIRNYDANVHVKMPYLMVNSCHSTNKTFDIADLTYKYHLNPYFSYPKDEEFYVCSVVTKRVLNEFMLFRYSMRQYHEKCKWILSTDAEVANVLKNYPDIECHVLVDTEGCHRFNDKNQQDNFDKVVRTKMEISQISIERHGYALLMDTDMVILSEFPSHIFNIMKNSSFDTVVADHRLLDKQLEQYVGKFNTGMVILKNKQLVEDWLKIHDSKQYFTDQKPYEVAVNNGGYIVGNLPDNFNVAYWRVDNDKSLKMQLVNNKDICLNHMLIVNAHVHMIPDNTLTHDVQNNTHKNNILNMLEVSKSKKHADLVKYLRDNYGNVWS